VLECAFVQFQALSILYSSPCLGDEGVGDLRGLRGESGARTGDSRVDGSAARREKDSSDAATRWGIRGDASGLRRAHLRGAIMAQSCRAGRRGRQSDECERSSPRRELRHLVTGRSTAKHAGREASNSTVSVAPKDSWRRTDACEEDEQEEDRLAGGLVLRIESSDGWFTKEMSVSEWWKSSSDDVRSGRRGARSRTPQFWSSDAKSLQHNEEVSGSVTTAAARRASDSALFAIAGTRESLSVRIPRRSRWPGIKGNGADADAADAMRNASHRLVVLPPTKPHSSSLLGGTIMELIVILYWLNSRRLRATSMLAATDTLVSFVAAGLRWEGGCVCADFLGLNCVSNAPTSVEKE
jgi:hypothetical protein